MTGQLRPGQVAAAAGVNLETLRYYERRGLLDRPDRTLGGHRMYPTEAVTVLRIIKTAQRLGFSLTEVADLLDIATRRHGPQRSAYLQTRAKAKLDEVEKKITDLTAIRDTLREAISGMCVDLIECTDTPTCPLPISKAFDPEWLPTATPVSGTDTRGRPEPSEDGGPQSDTQSKPRLTVGTSKTHSG